MGWAAAGPCSPVQVQPPCRSSLSLAYSHLCRQRFLERSSHSQGDEGKKTEAPYTSRYWFLHGGQPGYSVTKGKHVPPTFTMTTSNETHQPLLCRASGGTSLPRHHPLIHSFTTTQESPDTEETLGPPK